jgi:hypothetical protein
MVWRRRTKGRLGLIWDKHFLSASPADVVCISWAESATKKKTGVFASHIGLWDIGLYFIGHLRGVYRSTLCFFI